MKNKAKLKTPSVRKMILEAYLVGMSFTASVFLLYYYVFTVLTGWYSVALSYLIGWLFIGLTLVVIIVSKLQGRTLPRIFMIIAHIFSALIFILLTLSLIGHMLDFMGITCAGFFYQQTTCSSYVSVLLILMQTGGFQVLVGLALIALGSMAYDKLIAGKTSKK